jgi:serine/threonine protein kinase
VKITPDGKVKVLDFGLAKAMDNNPATTLANSPTLVSGSMGGMIVGTAAYMSPEQARGKEAGRTSDIWALGCVLYEMLTGEHASLDDVVRQSLAFCLRRTKRAQRACHASGSQEPKQFAAFHMNPILNLDLECLRRS